jgi:hypothetical protein
MTNRWTIRLRKRGSWPSRTGWAAVVVDDAVEDEMDMGETVSSVSDRSKTLQAVAACGLGPEADLRATRVRARSPLFREYPSPLPAHLRRR